MLDQLTSMRIFVSIIEEGSISAAAQMNQMSATMATKHLNALESRLGNQLILRSTRRLVLTEQGDAYLKFCRRILLDIAESEATISEKSLSPQGLLRISAPVAFGQKFLAQHMGDFLSLHPQLALELDLNDGFVDLNDSGFDMAIRIAKLNDSDLRARKLCAIDTAVCASPIYLAEFGTPSTLQELSKHNVLGYTESDAYSRQFWRTNSASKDRYQGLSRFFSNSGEALASAAASGLGITVGPAYLMQPGIDNGSLICLEGIDLPTISSLTAYAVYPAHRRTPLKIRVMVDFLVTLFKNGLSEQGNFK
ncbi:MAG: LysR family transcriptional regulator [Rhodobacteraceae bacterium]|nr:LysR family transcriptional regulator [Paracoccaceae bacterium]